MSTTTTGDSILPHLPNTAAIVSLLAALARVDRELLEIDQRTDRDTAPAVLVAMGRADWEHERKLIQLELAALATAACKEDL